MLIAFVPIAAATDDEGALGAEEDGVCDWLLVFAAATEAAGKDGFDDEELAGRDGAAALPLSSLTLEGRGELCELLTMRKNQGYNYPS